MTEEAMGRHDTTRHEVSPIKERTYWQFERSREEGSEGLIPPLGGINLSRKEIYTPCLRKNCTNCSCQNFVKLLVNLLAWRIMYDHSKHKYTCTTLFSKLVNL